MLAAGVASSTSTLLPRLLQIGNAAPVNPSAVYVPNPAPNGTTLNTTMIGRVFALGVPGALRAAGQVGIEPNVMVEQETDASFGFVRVNYHYNITAAEFGLQNIPGLIFYVNESCYTEYGWFRGTINDNASTTDVYHLWNDPNYLKQSSTRDDGPPFPLFKSNRTSGPILGNNSYAIVISSLDRFSYTPGTDPWYLTIPYNTSDSPYPFIVDTGRPALSWWETNIFHYQGKISDVWNINELHPAFGSSHSTPSFLADILQLSLNEPMITLIGTRLGRSALASSSSSALGVAFDANTSSIYRDLEYLAVASYIRTRDIFAETTRFSEQGREGIPDLARDNDDKPRAETGDFVITSPNIATLSIRALIIVPAVTGGMVLVAFLFKRVLRSSDLSRALGATMLYSYLHELAGREGRESENWNREGDVAFSSQKAPARIMPVLHEKEVQWNFQSK